MSRITENVIEEFCIELLEKQGYEYIYAPDIAPDSDNPLRSSFEEVLLFNRLSDAVARIKLWQRNFWEHIIRNENEYRRITQYILDNPKKWAMDKLNGGDGNQVMESPVGYNAEAWMT